MFEHDTIERLEIELYDLEEENQQLIAENETLHHHAACALDDLHDAREALAAAQDQIKHLEREVARLSRHVYPTYEAIQ